MPTLLTAQDWAKLQDIFEEAAHLTGSARDAYLDEVCSDAPFLRCRVESLLVSSESDTHLGGLIGSAAADTLTSSLPVIGDILGPYRITTVLGRGGMGIVYAAVRADDEFHKEVAIKVAAVSVLAPELRQRFLRERQILANLDHPNIARLLDGGATAEGMPFVVMELVHGRPIDRYCAEERLNQQARLRLMILVARAVDFAHRHLVVHRDLKPDNILITEDGEPKLLDFGIAKALDVEDISLQAGLTLDAMRLMTPDYASPEQVQGHAITTATDVYQLGILLYLLLTGKRPFQIASTTRIGELERMICDVPPPRPDLDSDLARILLQALEKEPSRRYVSAGTLAEDIERFLGGYPVLARPSSWRYASAKFIRRHRLAVAAAATLVLMLAGTAIAMTVLARRASQQARIANQTTTFLLGLFEANDPNQGRGDKITARELLDKGASRLEASPGQDPVVQVTLLDTMGKIYNELGISEKGKEMLEKSLQLRLAHMPADGVDIADTLVSLASVESDLSHYRQSIELNQRALAAYRKRYRDQDERVAVCLSRISSNYWQLDDMTQAEAYERQAIDLSTHLVGRRNLQTIGMIGNLGSILDLEGKPLEAEPYYREYLNAQLAASPPNPVSLAAGWNEVGWVDYRLGRFAQAENELRRSLAFCLEAYGPQHPRTAGAQFSLAYILLTRDKDDEALALATQSKETLEKLYGLTHRETAYAEDSLGLALLAKGRVAEARREFSAALNARRILLPANHMQTGKTWMFLGQADFAAGRFATAEEEARKAIAILQSTYGSHGHLQMAEFDLLLIETLTAEGKLGDAEQFGQESLTAYRKLLPPKNPRIAAIESAVGWTLYRENQSGLALPLLRDALESDEKSYGPNTAQTALVGVRLAVCLAALRQQKTSDVLMAAYANVLRKSANPIYGRQLLGFSLHPSSGGGNARTSPRNF